MACPWTDYDRRVGWVLAVLVFVAFGICAQPRIWSEMKEKFPDESAVYLFRNKVVTLEIRGDSVGAQATVEESILFLKDRPDNLSDMRIHGSHFQEIENIQAATKLWDKSKYRDIPLSGLTRQREDDSGIFFDDSYFYHLSFPAGQAGNQAVWSFREKYRDARFLPIFFFQSYLPQVTGSFTVRTPPGVEISWRVLNDTNNLIQFRQFEKNGFVHYEWKGTNLPPFRLGEKAPSLAYFVPVVVCHVAAIPSRKGRVSVLADLSDLQRWYGMTLGKMREKPADQVTEFARSLVGPTDSEIEKVKKVFYWVQDNIRYIAFEDGMRGLVPHPPGYVLEKRYGDCKDMSSLIVGLLQALGINAYYTWIGTRDLPFQYSMFPSPVVDNHMIASYQDAAGNWYFLDGTGNFTSLGLPSSMIQGKEAFILLTDSTYAVKKVPELASPVSLSIDTAWLKLEQGVLRGRGAARFSGYQKIFASYDVAKTTTTAQRENLIDWLRKGSNKFILDKYAISNLENKEQPLRVTYDFHISDYVSQAGTEIFVNLNLVKIYLNEVVQPDRKVPMEFDYRFSSRRVYNFEIPADYDVDYVPPDAHLDAGLVSFAISYQRVGSIIRVTHHLDSNVLMLTPDQFQNWNEAVRQLSDAYKESVILKKK